MGIANWASDKTAAYETLRRLADAPSVWLHDPRGARLWLDGLDAVRSTPPLVFSTYAEAFADVVRRCHPNARDPDDLGPHDLLASAEAFLRALALDEDDTRVWHGLAVALASCERAADSLALGTGVIINDVLLLIASPTYRAIRLAAFNDGVRAIVRRDLESGPFRPEYGYFVATPPYVVDHAPPFIQQYNINHDVAHLVLFGDAYLRPIGTAAMTGELLLNAEEACCSLDLFVVAELRRLRKDLHALVEMRGVERGIRSGGTQSLLQTASADPATQRWYQYGLKSAALRRVPAPSPVSSRLCGRDDVPADIDDWLGGSAQQGHANWWIEQARSRTHNSAFASVVSCLPPRTDQWHNLVRSALTEWDPTRPPIDAHPADVALREVRLAQNRLRAVVVRLAEALTTVERSALADSAHEQVLTQTWRATEMLESGSALRGDQIADFTWDAAVCLERCVGRRSVDEWTRWLDRLPDLESGRVPVGWPC